MREQILKIIETEIKLRRLKQINREMDKCLILKKKLQVQTNRVDKLITAYEKRFGVNLRPYKE